MIKKIVLAILFFISTAINAIESPKDKPSSRSKPYQRYRPQRLLNQHLKNSVLKVHKKVRKRENIKPKKDFCEHSNT